MDKIYVFFEEDLSEDIIDQIVESGIAVKLNEDHLLAKTKTIKFENEELVGYPLEDYIESYDGGYVVPLCEGLEVEVKHAIDILLGELYQPSNDEGLTWAERIYNSAEPFVEIKNCINRFISVAIEMLVTEIQSQQALIDEKIKNRTLEWE